MTEFETEFKQGNPQQCKSCIHRHDGLQLASGRMAEIMQEVNEGTNHICHSNSRYACRGSRDIQLRLFWMEGLISEPTDAALEKANKEYLDAISD